MDYFNGVNIEYSKEGISFEQFLKMVDKAKKNSVKHPSKDKDIFTPMGIIVDFSGTMHQYHTMLMDILDALSMGLQAVGRRKFYINLICIYKDKARLLFFGTQQKFRDYINPQNNGVVYLPDDGWGRTPLVEAIELSDSVNEEIIKFCEAEDRKLCCTIPILFTVTDSIETENEEIKNISRRIYQEGLDKKRITFELAVKSLFDEAKTEGGLGLSDYNIEIGKANKDETDKVIKKIVKALQTGSSSISKDAEGNQDSDIPDRSKYEEYREYQNDVLCANIDFHWSRVMLGAVTEQE